MVVMERDEPIIKINDSSDAEPRHKTVRFSEKIVAPNRSRWKRIVISASFSFILMACFLMMLSKAEDAGFVETKLNLGWFKSGDSGFDGNAGKIEQPVVININNKPKSELKPHSTTINTDSSAEKAEGSACISWDVDKC